MSGQRTILPLYLVATFLGDAMALAKLNKVFCALSIVPSQNLTECHSSSSSTLRCVMSVREIMKLRPSDGQSENMNISVHENGGMPDFKTMDQPHVRPQFRVLSRISKKRSCPDVREGAIVFRTVLDGLALVSLSTLLHVYCLSILC